MHLHATALAASHFDRKDMMWGDRRRAGLLYRLCIGCVIAPRILPDVRGEW